MRAQAYHCDTLELKVFFRRDMSTIDQSFKSNSKSLLEFKSGMNNLTTDHLAVIQYVSIFTTTSPEGSVLHNLLLSDARAKSIRKYLIDNLGISPQVIRYTAVGEDWLGLKKLLEDLDSPPHWVPQVLGIINASGGQATDELEDRIKEIDNGRAWAWMDEHLFPELRSAGGAVTCVVQYPYKEVVNHADTGFVSHRDTVYVPYKVTDIQKDTVFVDSGKTIQKKTKDFSGRKFLFAARTNILAIPLANVGIEIPLGKHWSFGVDYYYPWMWRDNVHKSCYELLALDLELRYWFENKKAPENSRLLGHSIGLYAAAGHYDYQWNWTGHQGEFLNAGIDYLYSCPVAKGRMHMEFEIGFGYIYSEAQPYDCFKTGDKCYRRVGVKKYIHWLGPTRAQISLVVPIYGKKKEVIHEVY